jgi:hypothetical protein
MNDGKDDEKFQFIDSSEIIDSSKKRQRIYNGQ